jgi:hypothetical protein
MFTRRRNAENHSSYFHRRETLKSRIYVMNFSTG